MWSIFFIICALLCTCYGDTDPLEFLRKYGYLNAGYAASDEAAVTAAIRNMQKFAGIPETGLLDKITLVKMASPRCGVSDHEQHGYAIQKWTKHALDYRIMNFTPDLDTANTSRIIQEAFAVWKKYTPLTFKRVQSIGDLNINFGPGRHAQCLDYFDGPGGVLAHAFYPPDGRVHFDDDENFTDKTSKGINLHSVAAHEFGHALGLTHSNVLGSLMYPYYQAYKDPFVLHQNDIDRIQALYGNSTSPTFTPPVTPPKKATTPKPNGTTKSTTTIKPVCTNKAGDDYCKTIKYGCDYGWPSWVDYMRDNCYKICFC